MVIVEIDGVGVVELPESFRDMNESSRQEILQQIVAREKSKIPTMDLKDVETREDALKRTAKQTPGIIAGAKAGAALAPVFPHPLATGASKLIGGGLGAIAGGEATERAFNALKPPESWDDGKSQTKNLIYDFLTGQWDDY
ncbi:MAG: hypothetical protein CMC82_01655 [Flavobacteriaceae bacterium]|nr:hypothetical protein [Flavobacteriaceae bacterium]|tara:strand:+ start:252 stop:674 length:423 start_codon:yes stop_codon:yes gene_type:complete